MGARHSGDGPSGTEADWFVRLRVASENVSGAARTAAVRCAQGCSGAAGPCRRWSLDLVGGVLGERDEVLEFLGDLVAGGLHPLGSVPVGDDRVAAENELALRDAVAEVRGLGVHQLE